MPDRTHGELIRELLTLAAISTERLNSLQRENERFEAAHTRSAEALMNLTTRIALLEHQVAELRKVSEEGGRRWWALLPALVGALVGGLVAILGQLLFWYLRK